METGGEEASDESLAHGEVSNDDDRDPTLEMGIRGFPV